MFPSVVTVELSDHYFESALAEFAGLPNVRAEHGTSPDLLRELEPAPTLYWLDAHWSGLDTAGSNSPCPVLEEIAAIPAHPADCLLVDDARLFAANRETDRWPTLIGVIDALREAYPAAHVTVLHDLILCVPPEAKEIVDEFGIQHAWTVWEAAEQARVPESDSAVDEVKSRARSLRRLAGVLRRP